MPSPVPYEALLTPIHSLLVKVDRCPRMHCLPVKPSLSKSRKGSEAGVTSWRSEQKIRAALTVVNKACKLVVTSVSLCKRFPLEYHLYENGMRMRKYSRVEINRSDSVFTDADVFCHAGVENQITPQRVHL